MSRAVQVTSVNKLPSNRIGVTAQVFVSDIFCAGSHAFCYEFCDDICCFGVALKRPELSGMHFNISAGSGWSKIWAAGTDNHGIDVAYGRVYA